MAYCLFYCAHIGYFTQLQLSPISSLPLFYFRRSKSAKSSKCTPPKSNNPISLRDINILAPLIFHILTLPPLVTEMAGLPPYRNGRSSTLGPNYSNFCPFPDFFHPNSKITFTVTIENEKTTLPTLPIFFFTPECIEYLVRMVIY